MDKSSSSTGEVARPSQNVSQIQGTSKRGNPVYPIGSRKIDGRDREIDELHLKLQESVENKDNLTAVNVCGIGGIGKTELCIHYIKNYEVKFYNGYICWIDMLSGNPAEQILEFASINGYDQQRNVSPEKNLIKLWRWQGWQDEKILLVYDDVWSIREIEKFLPPLEYTQFYILITSRTAGLLEQAKNRGIRNVVNYPISTLSAEAGKELFKRYTPADKVSLEEEAIEDILVFVGYLPIAILSVAGYAQKFSAGLNEIVDELFSLRNEWENNPKGVMNLDYFKFSDEAPKTTKHASVYISFLMTWRRLSKATQKACIFLSVSPIEITLESVFKPLNKTFEITRDPELKPKNLLEAAANIQDLFILNLVSKGSGHSPATYSCHSLFRDFFRSQMNEEEVSLWADTYKQVRDFKG